MYLSPRASAAVLREAERARRNRLEIVQCLSHGQITRRDLIKWGIFSSAGLLSAKHGLSPFVRSSWGAIPTGVPRSPLFGAAPFTFPMLRFDVLQPKASLAELNPYPTKESNQTPHPVPAGLGGGTGPVEGRPPGPIWAHQGWDDPRFAPKVAYEVTQEGVKVNPGGVYRPDVDPLQNDDFDDSHPCEPYFHAQLPNQNADRVWTFNGTFPPKLMLGRYGQPILFRHHNQLPLDRTRNAGFGMHTISTHEHNGHHGAENDGFTGAYFYPGQYYDYHWPIVLAGWSTINKDATDRMAGTPHDNDAGYDYVPGDWHETMSTHWFHDHMFSFTSQNVYKGNAAMFNVYSAIDRGNEVIKDGV